MIQDMKTILIRMFTVVVLMMISMATRADVKVLYGEKGTDKYEGKGGSIKIEQADSKDDKAKVTVFLTFTPQSGYTFDESTLEVYAVTSPDGAFTRAPEISGDPLKLTEEKTDVPSAKRYSVDIDSNLALWVKKAEFLNSRKVGYEGTYYIKSNNNTDFYLCTSTVYYDGNHYTTNSGDMPYLTTAKQANIGTMDDAVWRIIKAESGEYYYVVHAIDGKYLTYNDDPTTNADKSRLRVHLQYIKDGDNSLFIIKKTDTWYTISPKNDSGRSLNPAGNNYDDRGGTNDKTETVTGISGKKNVGGLIGLWANNDAKSKWQFDSEGLGDKPICDAPTFTIDDDNGTVSISCATSGATIYYTTDGSIPQKTSSQYTSSTTPIEITEDIDFIMAVATTQADGTYRSTVSVYEVPQCDMPILSIVNGKLNVTCATEGASIFYTINGADPTTSYNPENKPDATETDVIKAIAKKPGYHNSLIGIIAPPQQVDNTSEMTNMYAHYILNPGFTINSSVGTEAEPFCGTIDGGLNTITTVRCPLVGYANGATIKNVILKDVQIEQNGPVGAIAAVVKGYTRIYNCGILPTKNQYITKEETSYVKSSGNSAGGVKDSYCGGIVGWLKDDSRVINCFSYANVTGGSEEAGIVGYNSFASNTTKANGKYEKLRTMVMNCMFYGDITGGGTKHPVYSGEKIDNNATEGINNYNYYRVNRYEYDKEKDKYVDIDDVTFDAGISVANYFCSWPAEAKYLTRFEYYRSILNANRPLAGWWVKSDVAPSKMTVADVQALEKDASLMAKWVLEPKIAPYPILKPHGKYPSIVNPNHNKVWNAEQNDWIDRTGVTGAKPFEGKNLGSIRVTVKGGDFSNSKTIEEPLTLQILDMDTLNFDYCYAKVQLPYYNEVFGDPNGDTWVKKYANNYTTKVVTGWNITSATGKDATAGSFKGAAVIKGTTNSTYSTPDDTGDEKDYPWESGYNFADRNCTHKDLFQKSGRVFAQGGYYYVPVGVTDITIEAHWATARYVCNADNSYDRVKVAANHFEPAGTIPTTFQSQKVWTSIKEAIQNTATNAQAFSNVSAGKTVYDQAIVLIGNIQLFNNSNVVGKSGDNAIPFTLMSADFDFDNEPDYCLELQFRNTTDRPRIQPIRFDFLPIPDLGLAVRVDKKGYSIGVMVPLGHFEITETAFMHTTQFEYDGVDDTKIEAPVILNGGHFEQIVVRKGNNKKTSYFLMGGHFRMARFTPGSHTNDDSGKKTRHCAVNAIGGEYPEFYLSGYYRTDANPDPDNPHCYINGGKFGTIAGAGVEKIDGSVTFKIDHALIRNFYGGGINAANPISGSIDVTIDNSRVDKYCGGPMVGDMSPNTSITTSATGTTFREYYGGGNGGTSYFRQQQYDGDTSMPTKQSDWNGLDAFSPLGVYDAAMGYHAQYEFELFNSSNGKDENVVKRAYYQWARFAKTQTGAITNNLTDCTLLGNFYGGGNLAAVGGKTEKNVDLGECNVISTLTNSTVRGSAYGGGFSASIPSFRVHDTGAITIPTRDNAGVITEGFIDYQKDNDVENDGSIYKYYRWTHSNDDLPEGVTLPTNISTSNPTFQGSDGKYYCYTPQELTNLGSVTGKVILNIEGTTTVDGSVYGGGEESGVNGDTEVNVSSGTVGIADAPAYGALVGNVYGGGKGNTDDVSAGLVKGNTKVNISQAEGKTTMIYHNIYGGGAYGSVGDFNYDAITGLPTSLKTSNTGKAEVTITGGTIGTTGKNNGMVFGSSRGDVDAPGSIQDRLAWVYDTHVTIGTSATGTEGEEGYVAEAGPDIKGSVYGSGENGHVFHDAEVKIHGGTIGITSGEKVTDDAGIEYEGAAYPHRGNVYGGGCGTDKYYDDPTGIVNPYDGNGDTYNPLAGIVQGTTTVNIDGGLVVHNVYGAGAMGSVGTMTKDNDDHLVISSGGTTAIVISGGTVGVDGSRDVNGNGNGNVFGAARGDVNTTQTDVALVKTTGVTISGGLVKGNVYGGGETGDVGTYTTDKDNNNNYLGGSGICKVTVTGGVIGVDGNGQGHVFGAGKGDASTFECKKAMVHSTNVSISKGTVYGNVYGGGEIGRVETDTKVEIGPDTGDDVAEVKGDVFGAGKGLDTHGYSALVRGNPEVTVQGSSKVGGSVYGGGQIASVGKHSLVTPANASEHPELEEGMPFTLANTKVGICTVTVKDKAEIKRNVFGAGKGVNPAEMTNPGRMKPDGSMEYYNNNGATNSYGEGFENAFHIYVQTLALVTETHVTIGGSASGETKVNGSVYGGSESGFVQYHANVDIQDNCVIGTSSVDGNVYGGGLGISGNDVAGRVGGNTKLDINGGTTHGSVFGGGAYGVVKGGVDVNINGGIIDKDVYGGGALAHTNTAMWDDANSQLLDYAEVTNLIVGSSPVTGYYNENEELITTENATAEDGKKYYAVYKTNVNLLGGQLRDAYGGGLGIHDVGEEGKEGFVAGTPAYVYGDVTVELNKGITSTKGCIVERIFGSNNLKGSPKRHVKVHVYATQHKDKDNVAAKNTEYENVSNYTNSQYDTYLRGLATTYEVPLPVDYEATIARTDYATLPGESDAEKQKYLQNLKDRAFEELRDNISKKKYDVLAIYGGGNLAPYEPAGGIGTNESTEVIIDGCGLTSIKQVYGGGNAAPAPATNVTVNGTHEIDEVFGGGNGKDDYVLEGKYYVNPGANVGYYNYTHLNGSGTGTQADPFDCEDNDNATTKDGRAAYIYGSGVANTEIYGGRIHYVYGASNEKGNISGSARSRYEEDEALNCTMITDQTYGGGKNSIIDGVIDLDLGCTQYMAEIFGGSKNADVNSDIVLNITNGTYEKVFGGNNTSGNVNGSITVNIKEDGCSPIIIKELYLGGYLASYSVYGYNADGSVKTSGDKLHKDPRINVISASRIDNIYGGGYQATVVGNPHVNINMEEGVMQAKYVKSDFLNEHKDADGNLLWQGKEIVKDDDDKVVKGILKIGTVGNIYGGGNMADIIGSTYVEIGNGFWLKEGTDDVWETKDAAGVNYMYDATDKVWKYLVTTGEGEQQTTVPTTATPAPTPARYTAKITGDVFGGGDNAAIQGNTYVNVCAVNNDDPATTDDIEMISVTAPETDDDYVTIGGSVYGGGSKGNVGVYEKETVTNMNGSISTNYNFTSGTGVCNVTIAGGTIGAQASPSDVFGGGKGEALESGDGAFMCEKAMVDGTNVIISNGTVNGTVYGGGEVGRVNHNTAVTIGLKRANLTGPAVSTPIVEGSVYGAGKGLSTHGYAALVRGNSNVTVQGDAKVKNCVYGGGEIASVGKYSLDDAGMPQSLANQNSGYCYVTIQDNAEIGPDVAMKMITTSGYPDDAGHVFGAGKGILPYEGYTDSQIPWRVKGNNTKQQFGEGVYVFEEGKENPDYKKAYLTYIETLGLATQTYVTIDGNALVKGSVYGGSMNGHVQHDTEVTIAGGQIGCQKNTTGRLATAVWDADPSTVTEDYECASWEFKGDHHPFDIYDLENGKPKPAYDGHTFFGNVFGGGSGYYPYAQNPDLTPAMRDLGYADGLWHREAGSVGGNTVVNITGGHILTSVYGGNEQTDVGTYILDENGDRMSINGTGLCTINMTGGTVGVPRSEALIKAHPVTCYVFGAGKGDQRINFNTWTNVASTTVNISGNARIYGSTFGGGEDGHVIGDVETNIGKSFTMTIKGVETTVPESNAVLIGSTGTSGADGNIFGGGRGFSEMALTAGVVGGSVRVNIHGGIMLGTVFGGGRLASVGTYFANAENKNYGKMQNAKTEQTQYTADEASAYNTLHNLTPSDAGYINEGDIKTPEITHGNITVTIDGGTIGATDSNGKLATSDFSIGDVFGGCKGSSTDSRFGLAKNTIVIISGTDTKVNGNVFGGGEAGYVEQDVTVNIKGGTVGKDVYGGGALANTNTANWDDSQYVEVTGLPKGHTLTDLYTKSGETYTLTESGAEAAENTTYYSKGTWATGKYDATDHTTTYKTNVTLTGGTIKGNVYGGGLGQIGRAGSEAVGTEGQSDYVPAVTKLDEVKAKVYGDVLVSLNGTKTAVTTGTGDNTSTTYVYNDNCVVEGNIFGCNNQNGSPQSAVTVHVFKTEGWGGHMGTAAAKLDSETAADHSYHVKGVYGGGNLSAFYPDLKATRDTVQAYVIIDGCKQTSIKQVYGGGNAASTPATNITINATYEIEEVFGGGNGLDDITIHGVTQTNPGANVGYEGYPTDYDIPASSKEVRTAKFCYGSGKASVTIYDGLIHRVFGGSNNKGNVRESAVTLLDDMSGCDFQIDEAYGGGKNAPMDAEAKLLMACIPGLKVAYGGAQEADVLGGVTLTITNGTYERVFGGNNVSGTIQGPIVVNVEETGCRPIIIGELYGGGNEAPYSVYGYDGRTPIEPGENVTRKWDDPQVNVKSFTSIGNVYGGGYGQTAVMVGNPTVNINVAEGKYSGQTSDNYFTGFTYDATNKRYSKVIGGNTVYVPAHKENTIGAIYNVFGGGNAAKVIGNPNVNIGTRIGAEEYMAVVDVPKNVVGLYTRTGEGTTESPYIYTEVKGTSVTPSTGTTYYKKYTIMGADIRGNVYGGGNNAEVTGDTNVTIGKKATP